MKISTQEDIAAPIDFVFAELSDFQSLERAALRRGAEVTRVDDLNAPGVGMAWDTTFDLRGKRRELHLELVRYDPPNALVFSSISPNITGGMEIELMALSRSRTRMALEIEAEARTLSARLMIQSLKLARNTMMKRFRGAVDKYARGIEDRYTKHA